MEFDFKPEVVVESRVLPGVRFTLRRISFGRRAEERVRLAKYREQARAIQRERAPLDKAYLEAVDAARAAAEPKIQELIAAGKSRAEAIAEAPPRIEFDPVQLLRRFELIEDETAVARDLLGPEKIRTMFVGIEGYTIRGAAPDVETLLAEGQPELLDEIGEACAGVSGMSPAESGNWQWPTTGSPRVDGPANATSATPASGTETGGDAIARDISPTP